MLVLGLFSIFVVALHAQCPAWSFDESLPNGPASWGDLCVEFSNCKAGLAQSPIDIVSNLEFRGKTDTLKHKYSQFHNFTFIHEDYSYEARVPNKDNSISFFGSGAYTLLDIHFHAPAEHFINGIQYPLEVHYVHMDPSGKYAVVAFMYDKSSTPTTNPFLDTLAKYIPQIATPNIPIQVPDNLNIFAQVNTANGFYHYEGSTTIPPCIPGVQWFVSTTPIPADPLVLEDYTAILDNVRPLQPINNRTITVYTPAGAQNTQIPWAYGLGAGGIGLASVGVARYLYSKYQRTKGERALELDTLLPQ